MNYNPFSNQQSLQLPTINYYDNAYLTNYDSSYLNNFDLQNTYNFNNQNINNQNINNIVGGTEPKKQESVPDFTLDNLRTQLANNPSGVAAYIKKSLGEVKDSKQHIKLTISILLNVLNDDLGADIIKAVKESNSSFKKYLTNLLKKSGFHEISIKDIERLHEIVKNNPKAAALLESVLLLSAIALKDMKTNLHDIYSNIVLNDFNGSIKDYFFNLTNTDSTNKIIKEFKTASYNPGTIKALLEEKIIIPSNVPESTSPPPTTVAPTKAPTSPTTVAPSTKVPASPTTKAPTSPKAPSTKAPASPKQKGGANDKYFQKYLRYKTMYLDLKNNNY